MLKSSFVALAFIGCAAPAMAQSNPALALNGNVPKAATASRTCAQVQGLVNTSGKTVLVAPGVFGFFGEERVVADQRFCLPQQSTTPVYVPTRDVAQCFAGFSCSEGGGSAGGVNRAR